MEVVVTVGVLVVVRVWGLSWYDIESDARMTKAIATKHALEFFLPSISL